MFSQSNITFISFFKSKRGQQRPITPPKGTHKNEYQYELTYKYLWNWVSNRYP